MEATQAPGSSEERLEDAAPAASGKVDAESEARVDGTRNDGPAERAGAYSAIAADALPPAAPRHRISARDLVKVYGGRRVVDGVHLDVKQGEIVGLLGPNGAGKTTTFYMVVGLVRPASGRVFIDERDISRTPMYRRARMGIGYLAQEPSIFRQLSVRDNVTAVLQVRGYPMRKRRERCDQLLEELRISHLHKSRAVTLSGGERRRLEIARALATDPSFLLLDEPFAGVDPIAIEDIQSIVAQLRQRGLGILITDHNVRETLAITDRAYILFDGRILTEGTAEFLASDPQARKAYLGERFRLD